MLRGKLYYKTTFFSFGLISTSQKNIDIENKWCQFGGMVRETGIYYMEDMVIRRRKTLLT